MTTQAELLKQLNKQPSAFLYAFAREVAEAEVAEHAKEIPDEDDRYIHSVDDVFENEGGCSDSPELQYLANNCIGKVVHGFVLKEVHAVGGGEGGGDSVERVWAVLSGVETVKPTAKNKYATYTGGEVVKYLRATGYYESYDGTSFNDEVEVVTPLEVKVVKYFDAKELKKQLKAQA